MTKARKTQTFDQAIEQLEEIIEQIESGEAGLEQSLAGYEKGMKLIGHCRGILDSAEKKIAELTADAKGKLQIEGDDDEDADDDQG